MQFLLFMEQCIQISLIMDLLKITEFFSEPVANLLLLFSGLTSAILLVFYIRILRITRNIHHIVYVVYDIRDSNKNLFTGTQEECLEYIDAFSIKDEWAEEQNLKQWRNLRITRYFDKKSKRESIN